MVQRVPPGKPAGFASSKTHVRLTFHGSGPWIAQPVPGWPGWLRRAVARVKPDDFRIRDARIDDSLDLIAVARR